MTISLIFVLVGFLALLLILFLARGHHSSGGNLDELASRLKPVDVDAFRNLIDEREEEFLRARLPAQDFRRVHRERMLAAAEYVWGAAQNAAILIRLAEAARRAPDPEVSAAAEKLLGNAVQLRLYAFQAVPRLYLASFFPHANLTPSFVADTYATMTRQVVMLGCLQFPARGISTAL